MKHAALLVFVILLITLGLNTVTGELRSDQYVGSKACKDCHIQEYENFRQYSSKYRSDQNVQLMHDKLTPQEQRECYGCHTTGYGQPGGFVSFKETPEMGHAGCEVCHGPGAGHALTGDPQLISGNLSVEEHCAPCHEDERVRQINYKPLLHSGAH